MDAACNSRFDKITAYLARLRKWEVDIDEHTGTALSFTLRSKSQEKGFRIDWTDGNACFYGLPRPNRHYYFAHFEEENVTDGRARRFVNIFGYEWEADEEDVIYFIKKCLRRGR